MDPVGDFMDQCCARVEGGRVAISVLYEAYKDWAVQANERTLSKQEFGDRLRERGCKSIKIGGTQKWLELEMKCGEED